MQPGYATPDGTHAWRMHHQLVDASQWRDVCGHTISPVGLGTYLGSPDAATDTLYEQAVLSFLGKGGNIIDSAVNYRWQASERAVGRALARAFEAGVPRESIFISTKGGFIPGDAQRRLDSDAYVAAELVEQGIVTVEDIVAGCHCMTPAYLRHQVDASRHNLGLETLDLYYLHNPETQLDEISHANFQTKLRIAFEALESFVSDGKIRSYGCATWNGFRVGQADKSHIEIEALLETAHAVAGSDHHFRAIQLPFNLAMPEAFVSRTQGVVGQRTSAIQAAERLGVTVMCSAPLMQSQLLRKLPSRVDSAFPGYETAAARLLAFVMNAPGVTSAMCGMKLGAHIDGNLEVMRHPHLAPDEWLAAIRRLQS